MHRQKKPLADTPVTPSTPSTSHISSDQSKRTTTVEKQSKALSKSPDLSAAPPQQSPMTYPRDCIVRTRTMSDTYDSSGRPRLPSFDYFVRSIGHTAPTHPGLGPIEPPSDQSTQWPSSLPTPPTTSSSTWLEDGLVKQEHERCYPFDRDVNQSRDGPRRRTSFVLHQPSHERPRAARAYSNTEMPVPGEHLHSWPHGRVTHMDTVPGRGLCYVYDDGTICPKEIDGNTVNPKWGTTKAGKPRKRLGQACNTCREKKIKCDPSYPKCSQCQRFNRECTFDANVLRSARRSPNLHASTNSPGATTAGTCSPEQDTSRRSSVTPTNTLTPTENFINSNSHSSVAFHEPSTAVMSGRHVSDAPTPSKRPRTSAGQSEKSMTNNDNGLSEFGDRRNSTNHINGYAADVDPLTVDESLSNEYLHAFLDYVNIPTFELFPRERFLKWATSSRSKTMREKLVLYAVMSMGSIHSLQPDRKSHRQVFKQILRDKLSHLEAESYSLELAHITLFLALADFVDGENNTGYSAFVRTVGCVTYLQLNLEKQTPTDTTAYGFPPSVYMECRRRTYWAAYTCDTFACFAKGDPRLLQKSDVYLRLPCASHLYESGSIPKLPIFNPDNVLPRTLRPSDHLELSDMAYLIQITVIFSDVQLNAWQSRQKFNIGHEYPHDASIRENLEARLKTWADTYSEALRIKGVQAGEPATMSRSAMGYNFQTGKSAGLDLLCHYAAMELHRRICHKKLSENEVHQHAKQANMHAVEMLQLAQQVMAEQGKETRDYIYVTRGPLSGFAVFTAIDILTAAGKLGDVLENQSKIMELMYAGLSLLEKLSHYWISARIQHNMVKGRIQDVFFTAQRALHERKVFFYCTDSMTPLLEKELDLIYGSDRKRYLRAAYAMNNVISDSEIYEIDAKAIAATRPPT